jgi:hypothetical protein
MPYKARYHKIKAERYLDALLEPVPDYIKLQQHDLNDDLICHLKYAQREDGRRAAAYAVTSNHIRQPEAKKREMHFAEWHLELLGDKTKSSRQIARILRSKHNDPRAEETLRSLIQKHRRALQQK